MSVSKWTRVLVISTPIVWLLWDIIAFRVGGNPATESANIFIWGLKYPAIPLFWGYLTGHFFAETSSPSTTGISNGVPFFKRWQADVLLFAAVLWFTWDLVFGQSLLSRLVSKIPGPGHGAIEMVILGTLIGFKYFQMDDATE